MSTQARKSELASHTCSREARIREHYPTDINSSIVIPKKGSLLPSVKKQIPFSQTLLGKYLEIRE